MCIDNTDCDAPKVCMSGAYSGPWGTCR
jgi:hypothetical protein